MKTTQAIKVIKGILSSKLGNKVPLAVVHKPTFRCMLRCKYCGCWMQKVEELTTEETKKMMKEFADAGTVWWQITGGEPLIRKDIDEIIKYAKDLGFIVSIITNGLLVKHHLDSLKLVDALYISFDGSKKIHESLRGKGTHKKVLEAIKLAKEAGINVYPETVLSKQNLENNFKSLKEAIKLAKQLNVKLTITLPYKDPYNYWFVDPYMPTKEQVIKASEFLTKEESGTIRIERPYLSWGKLFNPNKKLKICLAGKAFCEILPNGKIIPCLFRQELGVDGRKYGFLRAFRMIPEIRNCGCTAGYMEYNLLFSLNPKALLSKSTWIKEVFKR
jgi:MoaA/NifB/PqqE/SkfB family radical SAM enzyme